MRPGLFILLLIQGIIASASEVLLVHNEKPFVVLSQEKEEPLQVRDRICVVREKVDIACGDITVSDPKFAIAKLDFHHEEIKKYSESKKTERWVELDFQRPTPIRGDKVRVEQRDPKRLIREITSDLVASNTFAGETISKERQDDLDLALKKINDSRPFKPVSTLGAGMNYLFPMLHYQQAMSPTWGLGMTALYMNHSVNDGTGFITGPGVFFTYNHYYGGPLNGFWWQLSPGAFRTTVKQGTQSVDEIYQVAVLGTVGYRYFWKDKVNFGFGAGAMYLPFANNAGNIGLAFNGIIPSVTIDAGIAF